MHVIVRLVLISVSWVIFQIGAGYLTNRLTVRMFERDGWLYRTRRWERGGLVYERVFRIRRWKDALPEAGAMFAGGFAKRGVSGRTPALLCRFVAETRRAELTHWLPVLLSLTFFAWNPPRIALWMPIVGFLGNAPFIMVQRYVRPRMQRLLEHHG
jgi:glycosyl-4,4'-diaponeurosporenoate acyltransferase